MIVLGEGFLIPEGPVWLPDASLVFVEVGRGRIWRIPDGGVPHLLAEPGGGPNGAAIGPDGALYVCNNGGGYACEFVDGLLAVRADASLYIGGSIQRVDLSSGAVSNLFDVGASGEPLIAPNDMVFDSDGGLWFTDHGRSWGEDPRPGALYHGRTDSPSPPRRVLGGLRSPNGIGLLPGGRTLIWSDTIEGSLWSARIDEPGRLAEDATRLGSVAQSQMLDSLAVQEDGRICVGTIGKGGITRFGGTPEPEHFPLPDAMTTNICFGGADRRDAFVTAAATGRVLKLRWPDPGLALAF